VSDNSFAARRKRHAEHALDYVDRAIANLATAYTNAGKSVPSEPVLLVLRIVDEAVSNARTMIEDVYANASDEERTDA
jgi:nitrate/nitrite-specific signal transduction histidine kinase